MTTLGMLTFILDFVSDTKQLIQYALENDLP